MLKIFTFTPKVVEGYEYPQYSEAYDSVEDKYDFTYGNQLIWASIDDSEDEDVVSFYIDEV